MLTPIRNSCLAAALFAVVALPANAADKKDDPSRLAAEGLDKMVRALESLMRSIPQYETPEITEDGDIIIRRKKGTGPHRMPKPGTDEPPRGKTI